MESNMGFNRKGITIYGQPKGPEPLKDVIGQLFVSRGWGRASERKRLEDAWAKAAGEIVTGQTRVLALKRGVLDIEVRGGVLLQELASFHKRKLLEAMKTLLPGHPLKELRFRSAGA